MTGARWIPATYRGYDGKFGHARHLLSGIHLEILSDGYPPTTAGMTEEAAGMTKLPARPSFSLPLLMDALCLLQNVRNPALRGSLWVRAGPGTSQTRTPLGRRWSCSNAGIHRRPGLKRPRSLGEGRSLTPYRAGHSAVQSLNAVLLTND